MGCLWKQVSKDLLKECNDKIADCPTKHKAKKVTCFFYVSALFFQRSELMAL